MIWEDNTGPKCSREEAADLVRRMMRAWPGARFRDLEKTLEDYCVALERYPRAYAEAAVARLTEEGGDFFPPISRVVETIKDVWPEKDWTNAEAS